MNEQSQENTAVDPTLTGDSSLHGANTEGGEASPDVVEVIDVAAIADHIKANYNFAVNVKPTTFHFKGVKELDDEGKVISTYKRESVTLAIPYPSVQGIIDILQAEDNETELALLLDAVEGIVTTQARALISDDEAVNAATLDVNKLSWTFIANMPKPERTGGGIAKEIWDAFAEDYKEVMPEATGKTEEAVANAAKILLNKFSVVKTQAPVLEMLVGQLAIYLEATTNAEIYAPCVEFLTDKADKLLNVSAEDLLAAL